jgi:phosphoribosylaminoimidazolecarboxamide formyltransferase/IMP cyclohydrolase
VIATNRPVTREMAETVKDIFTEVVLAPDFDDDALEVLTAKKNLRLLRVAPPAVGGESRSISGGLLLQQRDTIDAEGKDKDGKPTGDDPSRWRLVAGEPASEETMADLEFAWRAIRAVKSNAILLASGGASVGVGMGQVNRVDSCRLAVERAGERAAGSVAASDAFFPFADGPQILIDAGVRAIVQPGGSKRDQDVVDALASAGVTMYLTGTRHFFH